MNFEKIWATIGTFAIAVFISMLLTYIGIAFFSTGVAFERTHKLDRDQASPWFQTIFWQGSGTGPSNHAYPVS